MHTSVGVRGSGSSASVRVQSGVVEFDHDVDFVGGVGEGEVVVFEGCIITDLLKDIVFVAGCVVSDLEGSECLDEVLD
ncbi:MAG: hypothetical protein ACMG6E_07930 [Candidatus Roizmanbacteria bacterium]